MSIFKNLDTLSLSSTGTIRRKKLVLTHVSEGHGTISGKEAHAMHVACGYDNPGVKPDVGVVETLCKKWGLQVTLGRGTMESTHRVLSHLLVSSLNRSVNRSHCSLIRFPRTDSWNRALGQRVIRSSACSFARTAHSFACSALLAAHSCSAALRSFTHLLTLPPSSWERGFCR